MATESDLNFVFNLELEIVVIMLEPVNTTISMRSNLGAQPSL